ncbi:hypothetical protein AXG93_209s1140 [Marchantia polymorpha subsp. ruderalis]|uniref:Uncharacterized protein n=1 Tax=Marchantia polymorpha subsp. ruderalis TaxID=1480154 RepID=A0A176VKQ1_MARPO|nr:hypothetical protein AXG93_209s1140 [Marchantia polymorpha subsp. ruderalis]
MEEAALELGKLIGALNLGLDVEDKLIEKLSPLKYINMEGEDDVEVEYSTEKLVQLVQDGEEKSLNLQRRHSNMAYSEAASFNGGTAGLPKLERFERAEVITLSCGGSGLEDLNIQPA